MINSVAAFITTALGLLVFWSMLHFGLVSSTESILCGVMTVMAYYSFRDRGRIDDLEEKLGK